MVVRNNKKVFRRRPWAAPSSRGRLGTSWTAVLAMFVVTLLWPMLPHRRTGSYYYMVAQAHTLGLHGLRGKDPPNVPVIPEITGPFEVHVTVRFDKLSAGSWQRCFDFGNGPFQENIYLSQERNTDDMIFTIVHNGRQDDIFIANAIRQGVVDTFVAGVDRSLNMYLKRNGVLLLSKAIAALPPPNITRSLKKIGESNWSGDKPLAGVVLGLKVINLNDNPLTVDPFTEMSLLNLPGQIYGAFIASFYLRLDNLSISNQRIFDFNNGSSTEVVMLTVSGSKMKLEVRSSGIANKSCEFTHGAALNEMNFWHVGIDGLGQPVIRKGTTTFGIMCNLIVPPTVFRRYMEFGSSAWDATSKPLDGVILGFRVDLYQGS
jgi:hypothetical protein